MKPIDPQAFDRNEPEAAKPVSLHDAHMIRAQMNRRVGGVLLGFGGVATMIGPSLLSSLGTSALAQLACVTASLSYALAAVWARRFRRQGISPLSVTTGQLTAGALMMLPLPMFIDKPWTHAFPPLTAWAAIGALALFC